MSIYSALTIGVSALQAQSNAIGIVSNNISNTSTVGYKEGLASFSDLIYQLVPYGGPDNSGNSSALGYFPSGVLGSNTSLNNIQGTITPTSSSTDIAISGNGFIPVSLNNPSDGNLLYTRAGSFTSDVNGNLVNTAGFYLQAWPITNGAVQSSGGIASLQTVNVQNLLETPIPTTAVTVQANLNSSQVAYAGTPPYDSTSALADMTSGAIAPQFSVPVTMDDNTGVAHTANIDFLNTGTNTWAVEVNVQPPTDVISANGGQIAAGTVTFNGDGTLASVSASLSQPITVNWADVGAASSSIAFNWGTAGPPAGTPGATVIGDSNGLAQFDSDYSDNVTQNGVQPGHFTGVSINSSGDVVASFDNNTSQNFYQIPLASFINPDQLASQTGDVFSQTGGSGTPDFLQAGQGGVGMIDPSALEASNVDLSSQLTDLIVAQNAYQAGSKLVSTSDTMLTDLISMGAT